MAPSKKRLNRVRDLDSLLITDDFDQNALPATAVELPVKDLFPRAKIQPAIGDGHHHLAAHDLALQMRIAVVFARAVMALATDRLVRS